MASIPLIALITLQYGGRQVRAGQPFVASSEQDARVLTKIGRAKRADSLTYQTAAVEPDGIPCPPGYEGPEGEHGETRKKRTYKRRDLTAESPE